MSSVKLQRALRLNEGRATNKPANVDVPGPIRQLTEAEMIDLVYQPPSTLDPVAGMDAFEHLGGPFGGRIRFVLDAAGDYWACEIEHRPTSSYDQEATVAMAVAAILAATPGRG